MKGLLTLLFTVLFVVSGYCQTNKYGYPLYTFYGSEALNSSAQNWDIAKSQNGLLYVANNLNGVIEFDGEHSKHIPIEGNPEIRALAINKDGVIFVGGSYDFGYLRPSEEGFYRYINLNRRLPDSLNDFSVIYNVNCIDDTVFFSDDKYHIYKYIVPTDTLECIKSVNTALFTFNYKQHIYGGSYSDGLFKLNNDSVYLVKGGDFFQEKNIFSVLDFDSMLIVTGNSGIFYFDEQNGDVTPMLNKNTFQSIRSITQYSASLGEGNFYTGTIGSGINVFTKRGQLEANLDKEIGIEDHICSSVNQIDNILWGTLTLGLTAVEYKNPIRYFGEESGVSGWINDVSSLDSTLFVATDVGVFYRDFDGEDNVFKQIKGISSQVWSFEKVISNSKTILIVGTVKGIFLLDNKGNVEALETQLVGLGKLFPSLSNSKLKSAKISVWKLFYSQKNSKLWVATTKRLFPLSYINGRWQVDSDGVEIGDKITSITDDINGDLWLTTNSKGVYFLDVDSLKLICKNSDLGIKNTEHIGVANVDGDILLTTTYGVFLLNKNRDSLMLSKLFENILLKGEYITQISKIGKDKIIVNKNTGEGVKVIAYRKENGEYKLCDLYLKRLDKVETETFYVFNDRVWFTNGNTLYNSPVKSDFEPDKKFRCLVREVEGADTVYFGGVFYKRTDSGLLPDTVQHEYQIPNIDYSYNDITFHFGSPYFEGVEALEYSYKLEGFKEEWSKWNKETKAVFTNLNEGEYIFKVKAKNIYGKESTIGEFAFTIFPPWYRTILAYIIYLIAGLVLMWVIIKLYTRKLEQEKIQLEGIVRERTAEIREQRDEIAQQKQSIEDSILYASRIQKAILPGKVLSEEILPEHFILFRPRDIVSGDFFWMNKIGNRVIVTAADCTGHGVPGAFMSMLGVSFLNEIVLKEGIVEPHLILNNLRDRVKKTLKQEGKEGEAKDGMDIAMVAFEEDTRKLYFAGAYNPVLIYREGELIEIKADRMPIGIYIREKESFTLHEFDYQPGDTFYIFSDGYPDQFGGPKGQKFRIKAMKALLQSIQEKSMAEQREILNTTIEQWMAETPGQEQIDDMVVIGVRLR